MKHEFIDRRKFIQSGLLGSAALSLSPCLGRNSPSPKRPNIVLIMADDMGFSDPGCFGGEIRTPNIDRLAKGGMRFTQFFNCARCCPTRASLMTGLYPHQVGLARNGQNLTHDGMTIAEALKAAGYNTAMSGKWHLSQTQPLKDSQLHQKWLDHQYDPEKPFAPLDTYPVNRGFDHYYGNIWGVVDYFDPFSLVEGTTPVESVPEDYYITDAISDRSVHYIHELSRKENPFFLYVAHCAPHWPLHALQEDIKRYQSRYDQGWDALRKERYQRMLKMGLFDKENTPLPPVQDQGKEWDQLSDDEKAFQSVKMAVHAAMVDRMDQGIGQIIKALEQTGQLGNTIIFFLSDNGASPEIPQRPGYDRSSETREGETIHYQGDFVPGPETTYTGIGPAWASASNTPFRFWKMQSFEGGCHTPFIIHWPAGLKEQAGSQSDELGHVMDIMPTCLELAGAKYPKEYQGHSLKPLEGKSLMPIIDGHKREGHEKLFFEHMNGRAVRMGDWKLVAHTQNPNGWELYNLAEDRTEMNNLAEKYPERVQRMIKEWNDWAKKIGLKP